MKKIPMKAIGNSIKVYMTKHSPEILTGIGIGEIGRASCRERV